MDERRRLGAKMVLFFDSVPERAEIAPVCEARIHLFVDAILRCRRPKGVPLNN